MKNFIQTGDSITIPAPVTVTSGTGVQIGALFGIAATDAPNGTDVAIATRGVFELPKEATTDTFEVGDAVEWDDVNDRVTALASGAQIGVAVTAATATASTVRVILKG